MATPRFHRVDPGGWVRGLAISRVRGQHTNAWVSVQRDKGYRIVRVDEETREVRVFLELGHAAGIAEADNIVWVCGEKCVLRIEAERRIVRATIDLPFEPRYIALASNFVWCSDFNGRVAQIDTRSNRVLRATEGIASYIVEMGSDGNSIWIMTTDQAILIDSHTGNSVGTYSLGGTVGGVNVYDGEVWITVADGIGSWLQRAPTQKRSRARSRPATREPTGET